MNSKDTLSLDCSLEEDSTAAGGAGITLLLWDARRRVGAVGFAAADLLSGSFAAIAATTLDLSPIEFLG